MTRLTRFSLVSTCLVPLSACTFLGIVVTSNPDKRLEAAQDLLIYSRVNQAEYEIYEAMITYQRENDVRGLGNAYLLYAELLVSPRVAYLSHHFHDKSVTFDNRLAKAKEFTEKALENHQIVAKTHPAKFRYDLLTNVYYNLAVAYLALDQRNEACTDYDYALEAYYQNIKQDPSAKPDFPHEYKGLPDALADMKRRAGCPSQAETTSGLTPN
jgi:tetratricopeptide (TPR) repeat protein